MVIQSSVLTVSRQLIAMEAQKIYLCVKIAMPTVSMVYFNVSDYSMLLFSFTESELSSVAMVLSELSL